MIGKQHCMCTVTKEQRKARRKGQHHMMLQQKKMMNVIADDSKSLNKRFPLTLKTSANQDMFSRHKIKHVETSTTMFKW